MRFYVTGKRKYTPRTRVQLGVVFARNKTNALKKAKIGTRKKYQNIKVRK
jgi:hypothetical protein